MKTALILLALLALSQAVIDADKVSTNIQQFPKLGNAFENGEMYSGFLQVDDYRVHYWFIPTKIPSTVVKSGVQMWMNYGPSCSAIFSAAKSIAPFLLKENTANIESNPLSWYHQSHLLMIDPPGVGYSAPDPVEDNEWTDDKIVYFYYKAMKVWLEGYKEYIDDPFYFGGEAEGSNYAVRLAEYVQNQSKLTDGLKIKVGGLILGNPVIRISQNTQYTYHYPFYTHEFLKNMGILSEQYYSEWFKYCPATHEFKPNSSDLSDMSDECKAHIKTLQDKIFGINLSNIDLNCDYRREVGEHYRAWSCDDRADAQAFFEEKASLKNFLHISDAETENYKFNICNQDINYTTHVDSSEFILTALMKSGVKVWIFQGDQDAVVPLESQYDLITSLRVDQRLADLINYSSWYYNPIGEASHTQNGGSFWVMDRLTFVRFKGLGQNACGNNLVGCNQMYKAFKFDELMVLDPLKEGINQ